MVTDSPSGDVMAGSDLLIVDLASLRYRWDAERTTLTVFSAQREVLAVAAGVGHLSDREAASRACDLVLDRGRVSRAAADWDYVDVDVVGEDVHAAAAAAAARGRVRFRVALYNPYTAQVSVGPVPDTEVFSCNRPLQLPAGGLPTTLVQGHDGPVLHAGNQVLTPFNPTLTAITRTLEAHRS